MIDRAHIHTQIHSTRLKNSCTFEGCAREKQEIEDGSKQGCVQGEGSGGEGVKATQEARKSGGGGSIVRPVPQSRASTPAATTGCCPGSGGRTKESSTPSTALDQHSIFCPPVFHSTHTHAHTHTHTHTKLHAGKHNAHARTFMYALSVSEIVRSYSFLVAIFLLRFSVMRARRSVRM